MYDKRILYSSICAAISGTMMASISSGHPFAVALVHFAALPLIFAGLAYSWLAMAIPTLAIALAICFISTKFALLYFVFIVVPSIGLCYLATEKHTFVLEFKSENSNSEIPRKAEFLHWHDAGRLLTLLAAFCATIAINFIFIYGMPIENFVAQLSPLLDQMTQLENVPPEVLNILKDEDTRKLLILALPVGATVLWFISLSLSFYCAARIARQFGLLTRPWPDLAKDFEISTVGIVISAIALACMFLPYPIGYIAEFISATFFMLWVFSGLAVVHFFVRRLPMPELILMLFYSLLIFMTWLMFFIALIGVFEALLQWRLKSSLSKPLLP